MSTGSVLEKPVFIKIDKKDKRNIVEKSLVGKNESTNQNSVIFITMFIILIGVIDHCCINNSQNKIFMIKKMFVVVSLWIDFF